MSESPTWLAQNHTGRAPPAWPSSAQLGRYTHINFSSHFATYFLFQAVLKNVDRALLLEQLRFEAGHGLL